MRSAGQSSIIHDLRSRRASAVAAAIIAGLFLVLSTASAGGTSYGGALDPAFGTGGVVTTPVSQWGDLTGDVSAVTVQPDGDTLLGGAVTYSAGVGAGSIGTGAIARYMPDGSLDPTFGNGGVINTRFIFPSATGPIAESFGAAASILVQPDGKILVVAPGPNHLEFVRYNADGSLDTTFGSGGITPDPFSNQYSSDPPPPVLHAPSGQAFLQPDGKIVVLASGLGRFNADGTLDNTFGTNGDGVAALPTPPVSCSCSDLMGSLLVQGPNGSIYVSGGRRYSTPAPSAWLVARFDSNGVPTPGFGPDGVAVVPNPGSYSIGAMALQPDGSVNLGTEYDPPNTPGNCCYSSSAMLIRLNPDGTQDMSYGTNGVEITPPPSYSNYPALYNVRFLVPQQNGKIIALGEAYRGPRGGVGSGFGLERFMPDGSPDPSFGVNATAAVSLGGSTITAMRAMTVTPDNKIVVAGANWGHPSDPYLWVLMRYLPGGSTPITVTESGKGSGAVVSSPLGINCAGGDNCTAQFAANSTVTLTATPTGRAQVSWNGACAGHPLTCRVKANGTTSHVHVTFSAPSCVVPRVIGMTLAAAKHAILQANCRMGTTTKAFSKAVAAGSVVSSRPKAGVTKPGKTKVALVVSKGPRH